MKSQADIIDKLIHGKLTESKKIKPEEANDKKLQESYQLLKEYYLLNEKELEILEKLTGCDTFLFKLMIANRRTETEIVKTQIDYATLLQNEINARIARNAALTTFQKLFINEKEVASLQEQLNYLNANPKMPGTNSFQYISNAYIASIQSKKDEVDVFNSKALWTKMPWNWFKPTHQFGIAEEFVKHHADLRQHTIHSSGPLKDKETRPVQNAFLSTINKLLGFFGINGQLKNLAKAYEEKTKKAEEKLYEIKLPAKEIAQKIYEKSPSKLVSYITKEKDIFSSTDAMIRMPKIYENGAYDSHFKLIQNSKAPSFIQDDLDIINFVKSAIEKIEDTLKLPNFDLDSIVTCQMELQALNAKFEKLDSDLKAQGKQISKDVNTFYESSKQLCVELSSTKEDANAKKDKLQESNRKIKDKIAELKKLKPNEILPYQVNVDPDAAYYKKEMNDLFNVLLPQQTLGQLIDDIGTLGSINMKRFATNYALPDPNPSVPRDHFAIKMVNVCGDYAKEKCKNSKYTKIPTQIIPQDHNTFLYELRDVIHCHRVHNANDINSFLSFNRQNSSSLNTTRNAEYSSMTNTCVVVFDQLTQSSDTHRKLLDVYLAHLAVYLQVLKGNNPQSHGAYNAITAFIDQVRPLEQGEDANKMTHSERLNAYISKLEQERTFINTVFYEAVKTKQATKFATGQLSYLINDTEKSAMAERVLKIK